MMSVVRKTITGAALVASLTAALSAASTPAAAQWRGGYRGGWGTGGAVAAGVLGGFALGTLARPAYGGYYAPAPAYRPVYEDVPVYPVCHREWRPVYTPDGYYLQDRPVRVCR